MFYHHCRSLDSIVYGFVEGDRNHSDSDFKGAYQWLEKEVGFYPLFIAVGDIEDSIWMTGYDDNWRKVMGSKPIGRRKDGTYISKNILRKKGEFPNDVLFSFEDVDGVFTDFDAWHFVLNSQSNNYQLTEHEKRQVFKYSWKKSDWLRKARKNKESVQLVAPKLYLPNASKVFVRNKKTKSLLEDKGFENVEVRRLLLLRD